MFIDDLLRFNEEESDKLTDIVIRSFHIGLNNDPKIEL